MQALPHTPYLPPQPLVAMSRLFLPLREAPLALREIREQKQQTNKLEDVTAKTNQKAVATTSASLGQEQRPEHIRKDTQLLQLPAALQHWA